MYGKGPSAHFQRMFCVDPSGHCRFEGEDCCCVVLNGAGREKDPALTCVLVRPGRVLAVYDIVKKKKSRYDNSIFEDSNILGYSEEDCQV